MSRNNKIVKRIDMELTTYYGILEAIKLEDGTCWLRIGNNKIEITTRLFEAIKTDFEWCW